MLLRNSISNTKKFFRRTLQNFKSFFSSGYHRLPQTPPHHHLSPYSPPTPLILMDTHQSHHLDLQAFNHTDQWDSDKGKAETRTKEKEACHERSVQKQKQKNEKRDDERNMISHQKGRHEDSSVRSLMVERKLRELEMLDMGNAEYVLDIEEALHYYSRLTCPAYLEIVDHFFMQIYSEFFAPISKLPLPNH